MVSCSWWPVNSLSDLVIYNFLIAQLLRPSLNKKDHGYKKVCSIYFPCNKMHNRESAGVDSSSYFSENFYSGLSTTLIRTWLNWRSWLQKDGQWAWCLGLQFIPPVWIIPTHWSLQTTLAMQQSFLNSQWILIHTSARYRYLFTTGSTYMYCTTV